MKKFLFMIILLCPFALAMTDEAMEKRRKAEIEKIFLDGYFLSRRNIIAKLHCERDYLRTRYAADLTSGETILADTNRPHSSPRSGGDRGISCIMLFRDDNGYHFISNTFTLSL